MLPALLVALPLRGHSETLSQEKRTLGTVHKPAIPSPEGLEQEDHNSEDILGYSVIPRLLVNRYIKTF